MRKPMDKRMRNIFFSKGNEHAGKPGNTLQHEENEDAHGHKETLETFLHKENEKTPRYRGEMRQHLGSYCNTRHKEN
jgi:hypothetical protein